MELAEKVIELFLDGEKIIFENIPEAAESKIIQGKRRNAAELKSMLLDISKAKEKLNWQPVVSLEDGLKREYNWAIENKHRWEEIICSDGK
jgi:nucleoside-diphosphate-sugar epimerase